MSVDYAVKYKGARGKLLQTMCDLCWHSWSELTNVGGVRYSARLRELKRLGFKFSSRTDPSGDGKQYKLQDLSPSDPEPKLVRVMLRENDARMLLNEFVTPRAMEAIADGLGSFMHNKKKL